MIFKFNEFIPVVHPSAFVHPQATVTGNVIIGKKTKVKLKSGDPIFYDKIQ